MTWIRRITAGIVSFMLIIVLLITSCEIAIYSDYGFYEKCYLKYEVLEELDLSMDEMMDVTEEMMEYLRGGRDKLSASVCLEGKEQEFFNKQDKIHMADVRRMFLGGLKMRRIALAVLAAGLMLLMILKRRKVKGTDKMILPRAFQLTVGGTLLIFCVLGFILSINFEHWFIRFHYLIFKNDYWIFDPETDYMIRMLPEGLFYDFAIRIGIIFAAGMILALLFSVLISYMEKKKGKKL